MFLSGVAQGAEKLGNYWFEEKFSVLVLPWFSSTDLLLENERHQDHEHCMGFYCGTVDIPVKM